MNFKLKFLVKIKCLFITLSFTEERYLNGNNIPAKEQAVTLGRETPKLKTLLPGAEFQLRSNCE